MPDERPIAERVVDEFEGLKRVRKRSPWLASVAILVLVVIGLAWVGPKLWAVLTVLANPEVAALRQSKQNLDLQLGHMREVNTGLSNELLEVKRENDAARSATNSISITKAIFETALNLGRSQIYAREVPAKAPNEIAITKIHAKSVGFSITISDELVRIATLPAAEMVNDLRSVELLMRTELENGLKTNVKTP